MSASESSPMLPRHESSSSSDSSAQRVLSRSGRLSELRDDYNVAHSNPNQAKLPAAPVAADDSHELHDPRWADHSGKPNYLTQFRYIWREELAECLGTAFIILFGASVECQTALHYNNQNRAYSFGDYNSCRFAWAAGVACAVWVSGGVSGGHCNPTVTLALWLYRGFPGRKVAWYIGSQVTGATLASLIVYSNYRYSIGLYEGSGLPSSIRTVTGPHATAPLFFTFPQPWLPANSAFLSEAIASAVLITVVFALGDKKGNLPPPKGTMAFAMFIVLIGIGASMGVNTGYAMNGARDTGPRIALWMLGYGGEIWSHNHSYWIWGPWIGAIVGGLIGGLIYDLFIYTGRDSWLNRPLGGGVKISDSNEEENGREGEQA